MMSSTENYPKKEMENTETHGSKEEENAKDENAKDANTEKEENRNNQTTGDNSSTPASPPEKEYLLALDLSKEEVLQVVKEYIEDLNTFETHNNPTVLKILKNIGTVYFKYGKLRKDVCELFIEMKFAELCSSMLKEFNNVGIFKDDNTWFPAYYTLNNLWNFTDASLSFSKDVIESGLPKMMLANITHPPYLENQKSKNVAYIIKSSLSILQNTSKVLEMKHFFKENDAVKALEPFSRSDNDFYKATSMMTMTSIMDEDENASLEATGAIPFMVSCIKRALESPKRRHRGFTPTELTQGLARMAVNDANKITIVEANALPLFVNMMESESEEEQSSSSLAIWSLAFDKSAREIIKKEPGCVDALQKLEKSEHSETRKHAAGAMWVILQKTSNADQTSTSDDQEIPHIFISYCWSTQDTCIAIKDRLKSDGYKVWMDVDAMGGSTLEAMALGVEKAAVVLICASEKYKLSPNCRTEAEYTHTLHKEIIPLMMQRHYKPDGWLGMLMGAKFYVNFDGKYDFEKAYEMLVKELGGRGKGIINASDNVKTVAPVTAAVLPTMMSAPPQTLTKFVSIVMDWTQDDVYKWLDDNKLSRLKGVLADYNGKMICALRQVQNQAPEYFYRSLETKLDLSFTDTLLLVDAMNNLP